MSYDIIKSVRVIEGKVIVRAASNNVTPRDYSPQESPSLTRILQEQGEAALDIEILREFENGNFHAYSGTKNRFTHALERLRAMPEYAAFDWRVSGGEAYARVSANRDNNRGAFDALLLRAYRGEYRGECKNCADIKPQVWPDGNCVECGRLLTVLPALNDAYVMVPRKKVGQK